MKFQFLLNLFLIVTLTVNAQYSFEKFEAVKTQKFTFKDEFKGYYEMNMPNFFNDGAALKLNFSYKNDEDSTTIKLYRNNKIIKVFDGKILIHFLDKIYVADINGDGLKDIKLIIPYGGCGIASLFKNVLYLFQKLNNDFTLISFDDMIEKDRTERDFDNDGNYEIITMNMNSYKNHNYWTFNVYSFLDDALVNVNSKYSYPIMIQYLSRENYSVTKNLTQEQMKSFEKKLPEKYKKW